MKQILLICGLLLCIANIGYSQGNGITIPPPKSPLQHAPTSGIPIYVAQVSSCINILFMQTYDNVVVKITDSTGIVYTNSVYASDGGTLKIDTTGWNQDTGYKLRITNKWGILILEL